MTRVALRGIRAHLGRVLMSVVAVLLGVAFVSGTFSLRSMMSSTFDDIVASSTQADAYLQGATSVTGSGQSQSGPSIGQDRNQIPLSLVDTVSGVTGVAEAIPDVGGSIILVGADGTAVMGAGGAPSLGTSFDPKDPTVHVVAGHAPQGPDQIALVTSTMAASGLSVGDATTVILGGQLRDVTVVGEVDFGAPVAGATIVLLDPATAVAAYAPDGTVARIGVYAQPGVSEQQLVDRLTTALGPGSDAQAVTGATLRAQTTDQIHTMLGFVSTFLLIFASIALFVGGFIIANTFQMLVRQRQRELAMLRAVGASPTQVFASILVQAAVVGLLGAAGGVGAGLGLVSLLRTVLARMGMQMSGRIPLDASTVVISMLVGTLVSVVAAAIPARRAALVPPVEAMRDDVVVHDRASSVRAALGAVLVVGGAAAVVLAVRGTLEGGPALGVGAAGVLLGALLVAPALVPAALRVLAAPTVWALRPLGGLARGNVVRNPKRTASTAGALMIGMALVSAAAVLATSTQASVRSVVATESTADYLLRSATYDVPAELATSVAALPDVARADVLRVGQATVDGSDTAIIGADSGLFQHALDVPVIAGDLATLDAGEAAVQKSAAKDHGWAVGDTLAVTGTAGTEQVRIGAVIDSRALDVPVVVGTSVLESVVPPASTRIGTVFVTGAAGADLATLRTHLTDAAKPYLVVSVMDNAQFADELSSQVNQVLVILYALLGLSIVIAVLGIVNTLALSIAERTREIGLLRAVGLGRLQLASVVTVESVLTAVFGTVLGVAIGTGIASALPSVFADQGLSELVVPWGQVTIFVGLAVVVGALAAAWPAIRAARLDVLQAVSYE